MWFSPVEDQRSVGSCTANAAVGVVEYYERRAFKKHIDASWLFLYKGGGERLIMPKVGIWVIGVYGYVAAASIAGAKVSARRLMAPTGLITELPELRDVKFLPFDQMFFGGHDVTMGSMRKSFANLSEVAHIDRKLIEEVSDELDAVEEDVRIGTAIGCGKIVSKLADKSVDIDSLPLVDITKKLMDDIRDFKKKHNLWSVIVVNLSSTEPPPLIGAHTETLDGFERALQSDRKDLLRASMLYAYAAFKSGCPFINFTPSAGASIPALMELAKKHQVPYVGNDGKTGETLIKSVLALLFKFRAMKVLSWQSYNILGNMDGKVLGEPETKLSKKVTKDSVLPQILGYQPHTRVGIDYVPSLGDWKIAWDFILALITKHNPAGFFCPNFGCLQVLIHKIRRWWND